jgi:flagellin
MAISILNNIASLEAQNQLSITQTSLDNTLNQLSSGSRINTGADDAAGLAIANGLEANITALTQSAQNANAGVGSLQVADGALAQVTTLLNRAVTLATESANGSVSDSQRTAVQAEYAQINAEINSIGSTTDYNGGSVFTNTPNNTFLSDGVSPTTIGVTTGVLSAATLGLTAGTSVVNTPAVAATDTINIVGVPSDGEVVTIAGTAYTFKTALTASTTEDQVLIGATAQTAANNLAAAINGGAGSGTLYGSDTVANANTGAVANTGVITLTASTAGTAGNAFNVTDTGTTSGNVYIGSPTFTGGAAAAAGNVTFTNDLSTAADAQATLGLIDSAIASVASLRGTLGANVNRLTAASNVITTEVQNLTSAEDGITAANIPQVVANLSQYTILEQSGISALAQANTAQQAVLKLLQ